MAIAASRTLSQMAAEGARTKSIPSKMRAHFGAELRRFVDEQYDGNQSAAGRALGLSQPHLSAVINGTRGAGLALLLIMRERTGKTLDELLGLEPMKGPVDDPEERMRRVLREELAAMTSPASSPAAADPALPRRSPRPSRTAR